MSEVFFYANGTFYPKFQGGCYRGIIFPAFRIFACAGGVDIWDGRRHPPSGGAKPKIPFLGRWLYAGIAQ